MSNEYKGLPVVSGSITQKHSLGANISASSGTTDHNRLYNRDAQDQHPISAITGLQEALSTKLDSQTIQPVIEKLREDLSTALNTKARGLYFDAAKELAKNHIGI